MQGTAVRTLTVRGESQGLDKVKADLDGVSSAQERVGTTGEGMAKTTETNARRQLSAANGYERLMERLDRMVYLQRRQAQELAVVERAYETGHVSMERHSQSVALVNAKYDRLIAAETAARAQLTATTGVVDQQTSSVMRLAAANDNLAASSNAARGSTANIAAQFQDIGVTSAMGMSPIMIALQQGTQLSAVLQTMQNPLRGLATAFVQILNPVSLLTIGFVALTATAVQFFMAANSNAVEAADALELHKEKLDKLLIGYDAARDAARDFADEAARRPEGAVASDLIAGQRASIEAVQSALKEISDEEARIRASFGELSYIGDVDTLAAVQGLDKLGLSASSTSATLDVLITRLTELANNDQASDQARKYATDLLPLIERLVQAQGEVGSFDAALRALPRDIQVRLSVSQEFGAAIGEMSSLYMDPRSRYDVARESLENWSAQATATAQSYGELAGVGAEYTRVLDSINAAEAAANAKREASAKQTPLEKAADNYSDLTRSSREFIASQELSASVLGMTAEAASRLRFEQEMLNQAANDNIALTPTQRGEIAGLASEMAAAEERTRSLTETYNFGRQTLGSFLSEFRSDLMNGTGLWQAFGNAAVSALDSIAERAMSMAANGLWDMLFGSVMSGLTGGMGRGMGVSTTGIGFFPGLGGPSLNANGNVYSSPSLSAYSNQIHDTPKFFQFANGIGQFAEAGPEAIMPLGRDGSGRLGVRVANENRTAPANNNAMPARGPLHISIEGSTLTEAQMRQAIMDALDDYDRFTLPGRVDNLKNHSMLEVG